MRAICLLKLLLVVGLVAEVCTAFAIEEMAHSGSQARPHAQLQGRHFESSSFAAQGAIRAAGSTTVHTPGSVSGRAAGANQIRQVTTNQVVGRVVNQVSSADLLAMDRSMAFALPASAVNRFASTYVDDEDSDGFTAADQRRNVALLRRQIDAARLHSAGDAWLMALVGLMLVAYQLCRKHRFLRPKPFAL